MATLRTLGTCGTLSAGSTCCAIRAIGSSGALWSYWAGSTCSTRCAIGTIGTIVTRCALWAGTIKCIDKSIEINIFRRKICLTIGVEIPAHQTRRTRQTLATLRTLGTNGTLSAGSACGTWVTCGTLRPGSARWTRSAGVALRAGSASGPRVTRRTGVTRCALWAGTIKCINKSIEINIFRWKIRLTIGVEIPAAKTRGTRQTLATLRTLGTSGTLSAGSTCGTCVTLIAGRAGSAGSARWTRSAGVALRPGSACGPRVTRRTGVTRCAVWPGTIKCINKSIEINIFRRKIRLTIGVEIPAHQTRWTRRTGGTIRAIGSSEALWSCRTGTTRRTWGAIRAIGSIGTGCALWAGTIKCINKSIEINIFRRKISQTIGVEIPAHQTRWTRRTGGTIRTIGSSEALDTLRAWGTIGTWCAVRAIGSSEALWSCRTGSTRRTWGAIRAIGSIGTGCALWAGTIECINKSIEINIFRRKISLTIGVEIPAHQTRGTRQTLATRRTLGTNGTLSAGSACRTWVTCGALRPGSARWTRSAGVALWPGSACGPRVTRRTGVTRCAL